MFVDLSFFHKIRYGLRARLHIRIFNKFDTVSISQRSVRLSNKCYTVSIIQRSVNMRRMDRLILTSFISSVILLRSKIHISKHMYVDFFEMFRSDPKCRFNFNNFL